MIGALDDLDFEDGYSDVGYDDEAHPPREVRCRTCQSEDVYWAQNNSNRWVLYDFKNSRKHVCNPATVLDNHADAFNVLLDDD